MERYTRKSFLRMGIYTLAYFASGCAPTPETSPSLETLAFADWKQKYLVAVNSDQLRVQRPENSNDTVSEGMGYGMILSASQQDWPTFSRLWRYAQNHHNSQGLMSWRISSEGKIDDPSSATDADLDMAYALLLAAATHFQYRTDALSLIQSLEKSCLEPGTFILKPGDDWGGSDHLNPSYFAPAYYPLFKQATGNPVWDKVLASSRTVINNIYHQNPHDTGLVPNWCQADGTPVAGRGEDSFHYTYDAIRFPWRQAQAVLLHRDFHARSNLDRLNQFFSSVGPKNLVDGYSLEGTPIGFSHNSAFVSTTACAAVFSSDSAYRQSMIQENIDIIDHSYYGDSLRCLSLLLSSA